MLLYQNTSVAILMCTCNGENFLEEQLDSIQNQDYKNWTLYVNDDGSKDATLNILKRYQKKWGNKKLLIRQGPKKGWYAYHDCPINGLFYRLSVFLLH